MTTSDDSTETSSAGQAEQSTGAADGRSGLSPAMKYTLWGVGAIVIIGVILALIFLFSPSAGAPGAGASPSATGTPTRGPSPGATPADGSEVQPPDPTASEGSGGLPPLPDATPLVTAPLPKSASADGELVEGFPTDVMAPAPDSDVLSSSIATEGDTMQATLVARTDAGQAEVIDHYRTAWTALGVPDMSVAGSDELAFSDEFTTLSLAFTSSGTGTVYTIFAVLRTG